jgi:hypothetical protein
MNPFSSLSSYERFIYTLPQDYPVILRSTLLIVRRSRWLATLQGELSFPKRYRLRAYEQLTWDFGPVVVEDYGYEAWREGEKLYWYDSQPHPHDPTLAETHPHHKHIPPDIKHHRIPAPDLSFTAPNLPFLITEIVELDTHVT